MDWYRDAYVADDAKKKSVGRAPVLFQAAGGEWRLTTSERKRILLTHIFGVDIDFQAVEVTKLSLLLKVLEGESDQTLQKTLQLFQERALPDLDENIKSGNSLIGPELLKGLGLLSEDDTIRSRLRPFDWRVEFSQIFTSKNGGFDAIIGNPPYNKVSGREDAFLLDLLKTEYQTAAYKTELYALFAEQSIRLLRSGGRTGFIVPNSFLTGVHLAAFRTLLAEDNTLKEAILLKDVKVFAKAKLDSVVYVVEKTRPALDSSFLLRVADQTLVSRPGASHEVSLRTWRQNADRPFRITAGVLSSEIERTIESKTILLRDIASVHLGLILQSNDLLKEAPSRNAPDPIVLGRDLGRYSHVKPKYWFSFLRDPIVGGTKKLSVYQTGPRLVVEPEFLLGVLNSDLLNTFYAGRFPEHRIKGAYLEQLPIRLPDRNNPEELRWERVIVDNVRARLALESESQPPRLPHEVESKKKNTKRIEKAINDAVLNLYGVPDLVLAPNDTAQTHDPKDLGVN